MLVKPSKKDGKPLQDFIAIYELVNVNIYLLTIISFPSPVATQREPATLVAIFSSGRVIIGKPAHSISVPVVCALQRGLIQKYHKGQRMHISFMVFSLWLKTNCSIEHTCPGKGLPADCVVYAHFSWQHLWIWFDRVLLL
jgi:hypothetical protein